MPGINTGFILLTSLIVFNRLYHDGGFLDSQTTDSQFSFSQFVDEGMPSLCNHNSPRVLNCYILGGSSEDDQEGSMAVRQADKDKGTFHMALRLDRF